MKKQVDLKKSKSLAIFFEGSYWHLKFDISGFFVQIPYKRRTSSCTVGSSSV